MNRHAGKLGLIVLTTALFAPVDPACGQIIHSSDTADWARMLASYHWKDQDTVLNPTALVKFDLGDLSPVGSKFQATLNFYVEKSPEGGTVSVYYVTKDDWSFNHNTPSELFNWPTAHLIKSYDTGATGWKSIDISAEVLSEMLSANPLLSIKFGDLYSDFRERIASPSAHLFDRRPHIRVTAATTVPGLPDLTLGGSDIRLSDSTPAPNSLVAVSVTARNFGSSPAHNVLVRLYDGHPNHGVLLGSGTIPSITGNGGTGAISFGQVARVGRHRLYAVLDPLGAIAELDESNNVAFDDFPVQSRYDLYTQDFELEGVSGTGSVVWTGAERGLGAWVVDADVPFDGNIDLARQWQIVRTKDEAYEGKNSLFMTFDGQSDDGTIWIERSLPVDPGREITVDLSWAFGIQSNLATSPVYYIGFDDPENEGDFTWQPLHEGWYLHKVKETLDTKVHTRLWVAVGFTVTWETHVEHYLDAVTIRIE